MPPQQPSDTISSLVFRNDAEEKITVVLPIVFRMRRVKCAYFFCLYLFYFLLFLQLMKSGALWQVDNFWQLLILLMAFVFEVLFLVDGLFYLWLLIKPMTLELNADGFLHCRLGKGRVLTRWNQASGFHVEEIQTKVRLSFISYSVVVKKFARQDSRYGPSWQTESSSVRLADNFGIPHKALAEIMQVCSAHFCNKENTSNQPVALLSAKTFRILRRHGLPPTLRLQDLCCSFFLVCRQTMDGAGANATMPTQLEQRRGSSRHRRKEAHQKRNQKAPTTRTDSASKT